MPPMMPGMGAPPPPDASAASIPGQARAMGGVDPMMLIATVMEMMGPGATPEAARALLLAVGSGEMQGPAPGLEASMPPMDAMGPMDGMGLAPGAPMGAGPAGMPMDPEPDPMFPSMEAMGYG